MSEKIFSVKEKTRDAWARLWPEVAGKGTGGALNLYSEALRSAELSPFDKGLDPWQSAQLLVKLRNHLVHFKPATVSLDGRQKLAVGLGPRVGPNPLSSNEAEVDGWLSADCAKWAVRSVLSLVDDFATQTGAKPNYQLVLDDLRRNNP